MQRYPLVDLLRALAALLVLVYHVIEVGRWQDFPTVGLWRGFRMGGAGVNMFLVISGFVIGLVAIRAVADSRGAPWRRDFAERRLRRIAPLYLLTCLVFVLLVDPTILLHGWAYAVQAIGSHLLFVHNLFLSTSGSINPPNWSIGLEMQFYLLVMISAPWLARASIPAVLVAWVGGALSWRFATTLALPPGHSNPFVQMHASIQLPGMLDAFGMGIVLAKLAIAGRLGPSWKQAAAWATLGLALVLLAWLIYWPHAGYWPSAIMIVGWPTLLAAGFAALLAALVACPASGGWLTLPLRYLGQISYGIYLWHLPVLLTLVRATPWRGAQLLAPVLLGTIVLAAFSWHAFEKRWLVPSQAKAR